MQRSTRIVVLTATLWLAGAGSLAAQTTWYIDASASPPGMGTQERPFTSIQYAIDHASGPGDFLVAPGTYVEALYLDGQVIRSSGGPEVTFLTHPSAASVVIMALNGGPPSGNMIDGFTILAPNSAFNVMGSATIRRCILKAQNSFSGEGIRFVDPYVARVEQCTIAGFGYGVFVYPFICPMITLENCLFLSNVHDLSPFDCGMYSEAKYCAFESDPSPEWNVSNSVVHADLGVWNPPLGDFHLKPLSFCIDTGDPTAPLDPDGSIADIGAIPYDPFYAETPTNYCTGKVHSGGCAPHVVSTGEASLSGQDDFVLWSIHSLGNVSGFFLWGTEPKATPFAGGTLCVAPPFNRGPLLFSGGSGGTPNCSGTFVWSVSHDYMQAHFWTPGQILYVQVWGRDPGSAFPEKSQLSDAMLFQMKP